MYLQNTSITALLHGFFNYSVNRVASLFVLCLKQDGSEFISKTISRPSFNNVF